MLCRVCGVGRKNFDQKTPTDSVGILSPGNETSGAMLAMGLPAKSGPWAERKEPLSAKAAKVWWSWCSIPQLVAFAVLPCLFAGFSYAARERVAAPPCKQDSQSPPVAPFDNAAALMLEATCEYTCRSWLMVMVTGVPIAMAAVLINPATRARLTARGVRRGTD